MTIEIMIAAVLALVVALGVSGVAVTLTRFFREGGDRVRLQQETARTERWITLAVRRSAAWTIYDPRDPATALLEGPAVRLLDAAGVVVDDFHRNGTGDRIVDRNDRPLCDLTASNLWFETGDDGSLVMRVALADRHGNRSEFESAAVPRN
jgi:hypothetical protein